MLHNTKQALIDDRDVTATATICVGGATPVTYRCLSEWYAEMSLQAG